jgi:Uma2 family endonuclease
MTLLATTATSVRNEHPPELLRLIELEDVSWDYYEATLRETTSQRLRVTYDQGRMVIMSPLPRHERAKKLLGRMVEALSVAREIPLGSLGSTTWRRQDLLKGLEPDECYYVANEPLIRGRFDLDLKKDPPPDLVIEVDITHHPMDRLSIYASLGVPEVWHYDGERLQALRLQQGKYEAVENSLAFPFLKVGELERFLELSLEMSETKLIITFVEWVRTLPKS